MKRAIKAVGLFAALLTLGAAPTAASAQNFTVLFTLRQDSVGGATLSPDGTKMFYTTDGSLHVVEIASRKERVVWRLGDAIGSLSFSPDGNRFVFQACGITMHYPCDIYSMRLDGTGLLKLTQSRPGGGEHGDEYVEYFGNPQYSPDGSQVLVSSSLNVSTITGAAMSMMPDGSNFHVLTDGMPLFWTDGGKAIFIAYEGGVYKYDLRSRTRSLVKHLYVDGLLGRLGRTNTFIVACDGWLGLVTVSNAIAGPPRILPMSLILRDKATSIFPDTAISGSDFKVEDVSTDSSGSYVLLHYRGQTRFSTEILQLVRFNWSELGVQLAP